MGSSRYQKVGVIASGGMATVYLGRSIGAEGFERPVAIKVMHPHIAESPEFVSMFLDEARLASRIRHANVVATVDVASDETGVFIVMEFIEGLPLHRVGKVFRAAKVPMPPPIALRILVDALSGLHAAHELKDDAGASLNLVHRDVSPQNILVGTDGLARITDFGVARAETRLAAATRTGQLKGKIGYMSNEQLRSGPLDRRSDVYAAGIVAWELLAGERLFRGDNEGAVALAAAEGASRRPSEVRASSPAVLDDVVMKALAKLPEDRWPTAAAFAEALEDAALGAGIRLAKPRQIAQLLKDDGEPLPEAIAPFANRLRADVAHVLAHASAGAPASRAPDDPASKPTDQIEFPRGSQPSARIELGPTSTSPSAQSHVDDAPVPVRSGRGKAIAVVAGLLVVAAGVSYVIGTRSAGPAEVPAVAAPSAPAAPSRPAAPPTAAAEPEPPPAPSATATASAAPPAPTAHVSRPAPAPRSTAPKAPTPGSSTFRPRLL